MGDIERIRAIAAELLAEPTDSNAIERAAQLLKSASETTNQLAQAGKFAVEERKLNDDLSDAVHRRQWDRIVQLAPVFTTVVLAATLVAQSWQFRVQMTEQKDAAAASNQRQADLAEDARWTEALKLLSGEKQLSPAGVLLATFSHSPRYGKQARDLGQQQLVKSKDYEVFATVFDNVFEPVNWTNLKWILDSSRSLNSIEQQLLAKTWDEKARTNHYQRLTATEAKQESQLYKEQALLATRVAPLLKGVRPQDAVLDLSATGFWDCDWKGADLTGAILTSAALYRVSLEGADLARITQFEGSNLFETDWWDAARISPQFLEYLQDKYPYDTKEKYGNRGVSVSPSDYAAALTRLRKASIQQ